MKIGLGLRYVADGLLALFHANTPAGKRCFLSFAAAVSCRLTLTVLPICGGLFALSEKIERLILKEASKP